MMSTTTCQRRVRAWAMRGAIAPATAFMLTACHSLPDVQPFADSTAALHHVISAAGQTAVAQLGRIEGVEPAPFLGAPPPEDSIAAGFQDDWQRREAMFQALDTYAAGLVHLVQAGKDGAASATSLAESVNALASTVTKGLPGSDPAVQMVTDLAAQVYGMIARQRAGKRLGEAIELVDPVVGKIAELIALDLHDLNRLSAAAQDQALATLVQENAADLRRLNTLTQKRAGLDAADEADLASIRDLGELILLETRSPWYLAYTGQRDRMAGQFDASDAVLDQGALALKAWAKAHHDIGVAVTAKRSPSFAELRQVTAEMLAIHPAYRHPTRKGN